MSTQTFPKFLALTNFVMFNFGYHVHEKALLLVYVPLMIESLSRGDKGRLHLLGVVMLWSFLPLIPGLDGILIKNMLLIAQVCHVPLTVGTKSLSLLTKAVFALIVVAQLAELLVTGLLYPNNKHY